MKNERNHIDEWLKAAAEMGNIPVDEADWQHMKQLLQPEKKASPYWLVVAAACAIHHIAFVVFVGSVEK